MGGIYAREEGHPTRIWKAIYYHYLPDSIAADAPPTRLQLGDAAVSWAAVSLADKLDTLVGMIHAGERPTGSRDPFGLRRGAQGIIRILIDLPQLTGLAARPTLGTLIKATQQRLRPGTSVARSRTRSSARIHERVFHRSVSILFWSSAVSILEMFVPSLTDLWRRARWIPGKSSGSAGVCSVR